MELLEVTCPPCPHCGESAVVKVDRDGFQQWKAGEKIQQALWMMAPEAREMLMTGTHPECWDEMWKEED